MKKQTFRRVTQTGAKLLLSILALLLVLTGCNTPTPPAEPETTGTEQPTESPTEQPTENPTEQPTEQPTEEVTTAPEPVEARYDIFHALLEKSYTEKQEFVAETYIQDYVISSYFSIPVVIENGQIYLREYLYDCAYVDDFEMYFDELLKSADKSQKQVLDSMQNRSGYYILQNEDWFQNSSEIYVVIEIENALYFVTTYDDIYGNRGAARIHVIYFE